MTKFWIAAMAVLAVSTHAYSDELPDEFFKDGFQVSMHRWLGVAEGASIQTLYESTVYRSGISITLDQLLVQGKWYLHKTLNMDGMTGRYMPVGRDYVQVGQAPVVKKKLLSSAYLFISKGGDFSQTLVIATGGSDIQLHHRDGGDQLALELWNDIKAQLKAGSVYKNGVLEYAGDLHFLDGVDDLKFTWNDFVFPQAPKELIAETIDGFINEYDEEIFTRFGLPLNRGVLLYGPPGTGKSFISKVIASNILNKRYKKRVSYIHVSARHVNSTYAVRNLYEVARDLAPSVIFFEDIDLIAGTDRTDRADVKNELMQQLSGIETLKGVLTIGTTNVADRIDPALKRAKRLGYHFEIGLPSLEDRRLLLDIYFSGVEVDSQEKEAWATRTEGYSGADIKELCDIAIEKAINDQSFKAGSPKTIVVLGVHIQRAYNEKSGNNVGSRGGK